MMKHKKLVCAVLLLTLLLMSGCSTAKTDDSNTTFTGKITELDGTKVTMQLGTLSEQGADGDKPDSQPDRSG